MNTIAQLLQNVDPVVPARSLYVHIPFCFHKCHYCDFYSLVDTKDRQAAFTRRLVDELQAVARFSDHATGRGIETIFVGGGTPTLLQPALWQNLLGVLAKHYDVAPGVEFTVEANPETVTDELVEVLHAGGVNRMSVGCQSFDPKHLRTLERWHDPDNVPRAIERARAGGIRRISLDLIFGIPGQTLDDWSADLDRALELEPEHLSCYALTFEPGTAMTARRDAGRIAPIDEDLEADMFILTRDRLREAGFIDYEISNFARPGAACRHNMAYWRNENWLAAGPSASGHMNGLRWKVLPHLARYLATTGPSPVSEHEFVPVATRLGEQIMLGLRLTAGLDLTSLRSAIHTHLTPERCNAFERTLQEMVDAAAIAIAEGGGSPAALSIPNASHEVGETAVDNRTYMRLTESGRIIADSVISRFMDALAPPTRHPLPQISER
ncbi:MAG: radical SAM family heme chaperone HemW [Planctomycetota bacterium]